MIITEPVMECEPETSQAARAMIQPPRTPLQKTVAGRVVQRLEAEPGERLDELRLERGGERGERGEGERSEDVRGQDGAPQAHGVPEVAFFRENEGDRVERVLREELRAAQDDHDEAERVEHLRDHLHGAGGGDGAAGGEQRQHDGVAQGGEAHEGAPGEAGDEQRDGGAAQLLAGVQRDLGVDILGAGALEILLRLRRRGGRGRSTAKLEGHERPSS